MKGHFSILLHLFLILALSACGLNTVNTATPKPSRLPDKNEAKALLVKLVDEEKRVPGIVVGMIADDPQERWVVGYGKLSDTDERVPDGDTVFEIGSITKVFTGTLLAHAVVNGEVKLDDPISLYLPEGVLAPEYEGRSITLLDLATHTSGLPRMPSNFHPRDESNPYADYTMNQMYDFLSGYRLTRAPGSSFEYSNFGFGLLGDLLVRRAGEENYEALLVDRITDPLGMNSTRIELTAEMRSHLATPHTEYLLPTNLCPNPGLTGAGGIRSTANDLLTFLAANMGMIEPELQPVFQLANTSQRPADSFSQIGYRTESIGLGWYFTSTAKGMIHSHGGAICGFKSFLAWDPQRKIGVVVLTNAFRDITDVGFFLMDPPVPVAPQVLAAYAGRYKFSNDIVVTIRVDGTLIFIQAPNQPEYESVARSENQFTPRVFDAEITFYKNDIGEVDRLVLVENSGTYEAKKVP